MKTPKHDHSSDEFMQEKEKKQSEAQIRFDTGMPTCFQSPGAAILSFSGDADGGADTLAVEKKNRANFFLNTEAGPISGTSCRSVGSFQ